MPDRQGRAAHRPRDVGRTLARLLCAVFALVGALPIVSGLLLRSSPIRDWAATETRRVLEQQLGLTAQYRVEMELWPLRVALHDLVVPASDGGTPALTARRVAVKPRIFSLLAGQLDVGDIEIDSPRARLVLRDGALTNLRYRLPKPRGGGAPLKRAPFASLALSDGEVLADIDGVQTFVDSLDLDVFGDIGPSFEVVMRVGAAHVTRQRTTRVATPNAAPDGAPAFVEQPVQDDDILCRFDVRARYEPGQVLVRRVVVLGIMDADPRPNTRRLCKSLTPDDTQRLSLALSEVRVLLERGKEPVVNGNLSARAPLALTNRFVRMGSLSGWAELAGSLRYDGKTVLPEFRGRLQGAGLQLSGFRLAERLESSVELTGDVVYVPKFYMRFADGDVHLQTAKIEPFASGVPITVESVASDGIQFPGLMRDLDVTPNTIVAWDLHRTHVTRIRGTLAPLHIDADITGETRDFEVFDRAFHDPARRHVIGVKAAKLKGRLGVRPNAFEIYDTRTDFGASSVLVKLVSIGFSNQLKLEIAKGSKIDLGQISPLLDITMAGVATLGDLSMAGEGGDVLLQGDLAVQGFEFGGFPLGDIESSKVRFRPLKVDLLETRGRKGKSEFYVPSARLDFDTGASIVVDANVRSRRLDLRDFLAMWHFDKDPRFQQLLGEAEAAAEVHYVLGGPSDECRSGRLKVDGRLKMQRLELYEERYDSGQAEFEFDWSDIDASYFGMRVHVPSLTLHKGTGVIVGSFDITPGALLRGHFVGTAVPLSRLDGLGTAAWGADAQLSAVAELSGTVNAMELLAHARLSEVRVGSRTLPGSELQVKLAPTRPKLNAIGTTHCGRSIPGPFDPAEYAADRSDGTFHVNGQVFGGQVVLNDLQITRQRSKTARGSIEFHQLDLGAMAEFSPAIALSDDKPKGRFSGRLQLDELSLDRPASARAKLQLTQLEAEQKGVRAQLLPGAEPVVVQSGSLRVPTLSLAMTGAGRMSAVLDVAGEVHKLGSAPVVDGKVVLRPTELSHFAGLLPRAERVGGELRGELRVFGAPASLRYEGGLVCSRGELLLRGLPTPITDLELAIQVDSDELRIERGSARLGSGTLQLRGSAPLRGFELGAARAVITARDIGVSHAPGIRARFDADLVATWQPPAPAATKTSLPEISGALTLKSFEYTRPVTMNADLSTLAQRGKRTEVENYDPAFDQLEFSISLRAEQPLRIRNNLVEADLEVENTGLELAGTNQRFGLRGSLRLKPGGRIRLRRNEFEVQHGFVRFDDLTRIAPQVDVTATTEYRRYSDASAAQDAPVGAGQSVAGSATSAAGGRWLISMRAHGDADKLKVDLTSEPALAQDDIFLLLTVGLTRAELDQARSASVGESVALEALGALTGADRAVAQAVPLIDEFRFGSAYSTRTGRTEPTITIGKRLADRIRANITSGLAESREIRSNVEWQLSNRVSVEGSYDNVNDISSSALGNLGADIRWRLEFE